MAPLTGWLAGLRFPVLMLVAGALLLVDLVVPDPLPLVDEALLAILAIGLSRLRRKPGPPGGVN